MGTCSTFGRFSHTNHIWSPLDKFGTNPLSQTVNWHWGNHFRSSNVFLNSNFYSLIYWRAVKGAHFDLLSIWNYLEHQFDGLLSCIFILMLILWFTLIDCKLVPSFRCFVKIKTQKTQSANEWHAIIALIFSSIFSVWLVLRLASGRMDCYQFEILAKQFETERNQRWKSAGSFCCVYFAIASKQKFESMDKRKKKSNSELKQLF